SQRPALYRGGIVADLGSRGIANGTSVMDSAARRAERAERASVGIRVQLSGRKHPRILDGGNRTRDDREQHGAIGAALSADDVSGLEPLGHAFLRPDSA